MRKGLSLRPPRTATLSFLAMFAIWAPRGPLACVCGAVSPCDEYGQESHIFVGTVEAMSPSRKISESIPQSNITWVSEQVSARFSVEKVYKGPNAKELAVETTANMECGYSFRVGKKYLVFATKWKGKLLTGLCSHTSEYQDASEDLAFLEALAKSPRLRRLDGRIEKVEEIGVTPGSGITVTLEASGRSYNARSDTDGEFHFADLPRSRYKPNIEHPDSFRVEFNPASEFDLRKALCAFVDIGISAPPGGGAESNH